MEINIPISLKLEHEELHAELAKAMVVPGRLGEAAQKVARLLDPHFKKEEEYALPPLGLLPVLVGGKIRPEMRGVLLMTDRLKVDLPHMLEEHKAIVAALHDLIEEARNARLPKHEHLLRSSLCMPRMRRRFSILQPCWSVSTLNSTSNQQSFSAIYWGNKYSACGNDWT